MGGAQQIGDGTGIEDRGRISGVGGIAFGEKVISGERKLIDACQGHKRIFH